MSDPLWTSRSVQRIVQRLGGLIRDIDDRFVLARFLSKRLGGRVSIVITEATADNMADVCKRNNLIFAAYPLLEVGGTKVIAFDEFDQACLFNLALDKPGTVEEFSLM
jgi:hypothetical protein